MIPVTNDGRIVSERTEHLHLDKRREKEGEDKTGSDRFASTFFSSSVWS